MPLLLSLLLRFLPLDLFVSKQTSAAYYLHIGWSTGKKGRKDKTKLVQETKKYDYEDLLHFVSYREAKAEDDRIYQDAQERRFKSRWNTPL